MSRKGLSWAGLLVFAAALYAPMWRADFVWDDILYQEYMAEDADLLSWVRRGNVPGLADDEHYYPWMTLTYVLDRRLSRALLGDEREVLDRAMSRIPRATTLLTHVLTTLFVALLIRRLLAGRELRERAALVGGLVFAAHPIHVESVAWISGRTDTLAATFLFPTALLALRYRDRGGWLRLAPVPLLFLSALLAKETALGLLLVLPFLWWLAPRDGPVGDTRPREHLRRAVPLATGLVLAVVVYFQLRGLGGKTNTANILGHDLSETLWRPTAALAFHLKNVVWPWPMQHFVIGLPGAGYTALVLTAGLGLLALALRAYRRGSRLPLLAAAWFLGTLAPSLLVPLAELQPTPEIAVAERYLYIPSAALALLLGAWCIGPVRPAVHRTLSGLVVATVVLYAAGTVLRQGVWTSETALWSNVTRDENGSRFALPHLALGTGYLKEGREEEALESFRLGLTKDVHHLDSTTIPRLHGSLGALLRRSLEASPTLERYLATEHHLARAIETGQDLRVPELIPFHESLARTRLERHAFQESAGTSTSDAALRSTRAVLADALRRLPNTPEVLARRVPLFRQRVRILELLETCEGELGRALRRAGDEEGSRRLFASAERRRQELLLLSELAFRATGREDP